LGGGASKKKKKQEKNVKKTRYAEKKKNQTFDPYRSLRGRSPKHAVRFERMAVRKRQAPAGGVKTNKQIKTTKGRNGSSKENSGLERNHQTIPPQPMDFHK